MPLGDDKNAIQLSRKEWDCLNRTMEDMNSKLDKVLLKLYGDPEIEGDDGMYGEHMKMWRWYNENKVWKNKTKSFVDTILSVVGFIGAIIAIVLSSRQL